jgi:hypothetical protein
MLGCCHMSSTGLARIGFTMPPAKPLHGAINCCQHVHCRNCSDYLDGFERLGNNCCSTYFKQEWAGLDGVIYAAVYVCPLLCRHCPCRVFWCSPFCLFCTSLAAGAGRHTAAPWSSLPCGWLMRHPGLRLTRWCIPQTACSRMHRVGTLRWARPGCAGASRLTLTHHYDGWMDGLMDGCERWQE